MYLHIYIYINKYESSIRYLDLFNFSGCCVLGNFRARTESINNTYFQSHFTCSAHWALDVPMINCHWSNSHGWVIPYYSERIVNSDASQFEAVYTSSVAKAVFQDSNIPPHAEQQTREPHGEASTRRNSSIERSCACRSTLKDRITPQVNFFQ